MSSTILQGDVLDRMRELPDGSIDAVVTDPPYGIRFMGKAWDGADIVAKAAARSRYSTDPDKRAGIRGGYRSIAAEAGKYNQSLSANRAFQLWTEDWAKEAFRVLKPGSQLLCFASTRTFHRMASGVEDAGFDIRDQIGWVFGSGFPKSHNLHGDWEGWGTALKPAWEPIVVARKPLVGTVASNVSTYGTGAYNISACRIESGDAVSTINHHETTGKPGYSGGLKGGTRGVPHNLGRWPANLIHDGSDEVLAAFPNAPGQQGDLNEAGRPRPSSGRFGDMASPTPHRARLDNGSAARFFYCAKTSKEDRNEGCEDIAEKRYSQDGRAALIENAYQRNSSNSSNSHPTVKPTNLMQYLCRLVTPPNGIVLDPFMGSGSTGKAAMLEGFRFIGIEREPDYCDIAQARINHILRTDNPLFRQSIPELHESAT